jgi:multidrug efflux pump subunit AcrA (membrane-fusion protein)
MSNVHPRSLGTLTSKARAKKRHRRNVTLTTMVTVALCAVGGGAVFAATRPTVTDYRTVAASINNVTESVNLTGTVTSASRKDVAFETAGTVSTVGVTVGQTVAAGQSLATLDTVSLNAAITTAQQTVATANQSLATDLTAQSKATTSASNSSTPSAAAGGSTSSTSTSTSTSQSSGDTPTGGTNTSTPKNTAAVKKATEAVTTAQNALIVQYKTAQTAILATDALVASSDPTCAPFLAATISDSNSVTTSPDATPAQTTTDPPTPAEQLAAAKAALASCQSAITSVQTSEQATETAQKQLQLLAGNLNSAIAQLAAALSIPASGAAPAAMMSASISGTASSTVMLAASITSTGATAGAAFAITAATILSDEAAITAANAELAISQNDLTLATLTSPIAGTVAAVSIASGSAVSAGSTKNVITVIGSDGYLVSSTATLTGVQKLTVGNAVSITVPSSSTSLAGTISSVGILDVSTSTTPEYNVIISVTDKKAALLNGSSATLVVSANVAKSVLTVPTSALHLATDTYTVDVLKDGKAVVITVKIGAMGADRTQITSGIATGVIVILADAASTTIGDSTSVTSKTTGLAGLTGSKTGGHGDTNGPPAGFGAGGNK